MRFPQKGRRESQISVGLSSGIVPPSLPCGGVSGEFIGLLMDSCKMVICGSQRLGGTAGSARLRYPSSLLPRKARKALRP